MSIGDVIAIIILSIILVPIGLVLLGMFLVLLSYTWPFVILVIVIALIVGLLT